MMKRLGSIFDRLYVPLMLLVLALFYLHLCRAESEKERHLEVVKWDINTHKLIAVVSEGRVIPGTHDARPDGSASAPAEPDKYVPERLIDYEIDLKAGTVTSEGGSEHFSRYEAELMWRVMDLIVNYAGESVLWFDSTHDSGKPKQSASNGKTLPSATALIAAPPVCNTTAAQVQACLWWYLNPDWMAYPK